MTRNTKELKTGEAEKARHGAGAQIKNASLTGVVMSGAAVVIWFLLSQNVKTIGATVLLSAVVLLACDTLIIALCRERRRLKISAIVVLAVLNAVVFLSAAVYVLAPTQLFYPHFDEKSYAELKTRPEAEELTVETESGGISGWMAHNAQGSAPLVLYFCGNGENSSTRMLKIIDKGLLDIFKGCNIAIFDYPGYGKTDGSPSEKTLKEFGLSVYDVLIQRSDVDKDRMIVFGYSLGTGVADYVASERDVGGLILMAPYADGYDLFNGFADIFHGPLRLLVSFRMESAKFAENVAVKPLILASKSDEMVAYDSSVRLSKAFSGGCTFKTFENTSHNDFWGSEDAMEYIAEYLAGATA
jgi:pimeloyl-ACP methyl ester carboxylesterase